MWRLVLRPLAVSALLGAPIIARAQHLALTPQKAAAWREDLHTLASELPRLHKNPFYRASREDFDRAVEALEARIPRLERHQVIVGFTRLVAMLNDAHTTLAVGDSQVGFHALPLRLYFFSDGLFIRAAAPEYRDLVGARVIQIGQVTSNVALDSMASAISHENMFWVKQLAPRFLAMPEVLDAFGISSGVDQVSMVVEQKGQRRTVAVKPAPGPIAADLHSTTTPAGWVDMADGAPAGPPLWQRRPDEIYWREYVADSHTLYICYRAVADRQAQSNEVFFQSAFAFADSARVEHVILDLRENGGGNGFLNRNVVRAILAHPDLDRADRLFVIIGRATFSAGLQLVNDLQYLTNATLVGEPTGNAPNQFGDTRTLVLPRSRIVVHVSSRWHQGRTTNDQQRFVAPQLYAELSAADYRTGIDPMLQIILDRAARPSPASALLDALRKSDTALAARQVAAFRADSANRYMDVERELNRIGYEFLRGGQVDAAIGVFQLAVRAFPNSANVYDSLGEALVRADRRAEAVLAFRRALAIDSTFSSSRMWLRMIGQGP